MSIKIIEKFRSVIILQLLLLTPLVFNSSTRENFNLPKDVFFLSALIIAALFLLAGLFRGRVSIRLTGLELPLAVFLLFSGLSLIHAYSVPVGFQEILRLCSRIVFFCLFACFLRSAEDAEKALWTLYIAAFAVVSYGMLQYAGIDLITRTGHAGGSGYSSFLGNRNFMSSFLAALLPLELLSITRSKSRQAMLFLIVLFSLSLFSVASAGTRGVWMGIMAAMLYALAIPGPRIFAALVKKRIFIAASLLILILLAVFLVYAPGGLLPSLKIFQKRVISIFNPGESSASWRLMTWRITMNIIREYPLTGIGAGNFKIHHLNYQGEYLEKQVFGSMPESTKAAHPHNEYLEQWCETGLLGLGAYLLVIVSVLFANARNARRDPALHALNAGILVILVHSFFEFPVYLPATGMVFWLYLSLSAAMGAGYRLKDRQIAAGTLVKAGACAVAVLLLPSSLSIMRSYLASSYLKEGFRSFDEKKWAASIKVFEKSDIMSRGDGEVLLALGAACINEGLTAPGISSLERGLLNFIDKNIYFNLGLAYQQAGQYYRSVFNFKKAIRIKPDFVSAYSNLANNFKYMKMYAPAINYYRKALAIDPGFLDARYNLGNTALDAGLYDIAVSENMAVVAASPLMPYARYNLARALDMQGRLAEAKAEYNIAMKLFPPDNQFYEYAKRRQESIK